jgi:hypothetical protein
MWADLYSSLTPLPASLSLSLNAQSFLVPTDTFWQLVVVQQAQNLLSFMHPEF